MTRDELRAVIRGAGLRATAQRVAVLGLLTRTTEPMSHGEISRRVTGEAVERSTVYRNIIALARAGLVRRSGRDTVWRFELVREVPHARAHPHFYCNSCGAVECLLDLSFGVIRRKTPRALARGLFEVHVRGLCDACEAQSPGL
jgi:Fe2+ or Zn2+ uptake regulation protein